MNLNERALMKQPQTPTEFVAAAYRLQKLGQVDLAIRALEHNLKRSPSHYPTLSLLGSLEAQRGNFDRAISVLGKATDDAKAKAIDLVNLGTAYFSVGQVKEALIAFDKALKKDPEEFAALFAIGRLFAATQQHALGLQFLKAAYVKKPNTNLLAGMLFEAKRRLFDWQGYNDLKEFIWTSIFNEENVAHPWTLFSTFDYPELHLVAHANDLKHLHKAPSSTLTYEKSGEADRKLKIGYFSPDFRQHAVSTLIVEMFEQHDRERFEIHAYSHPPLNRSAEGPLTDRIINAVDFFHDISKASSQEVLQMVRSQKIDIAVDLCGITTGHRVDLFAKRLAPIQVSYLGYPGSLGSNIWDYIIADAEVIPEEALGHYSERIIYLNGCFQPNDSKREVATGFNRSDFDMSDDAFVMCAFNESYKVTPEMLATWFSVLKKAPKAQLWIKLSDAEARSNLRALAEQSNINLEQLVFADKVPSYSEHLGRYTVADIFLDTYPYNGHTTASDALWAGLPVLTLRGKSNCSRVCSSLLMHLQLPELVVDSYTEYEDRLLELYNNRDQVQLLKEKVSAQKKRSDLFDGSASARRIEAAFMALDQAYASQQELPQVIDLRQSDCKLEKK